MNTCSTLLRRRSKLRYATPHYTTLCYATLRIKLIHLFVLALALSRACEEGLEEGLQTTTLLELLPPFSSSSTSTSVRDESVVDETHSVVPAWCDLFELGFAQQHHEQEEEQRRENM